MYFEIKFNLSFVNCLNLFVLRKKIKLIILLFLIFGSFVLNEQILHQKDDLFENFKKISIYLYVKGKLVTNEQIEVIAKLDKVINQTIKVNLNCNGYNCLKILNCTHCGTNQIKPNLDTTHWTLKLLDFGNVNLNITVNNLKHLNKIVVNNSFSFYVLKVGKSYLYKIISNIFGYLYFLAWTFCLYPQLITNLNNKSVIGLNLDFVVLNTVEYFTYFIYNFNLLFNRSIQDNFFTKYPGSQLPVYFMDLIFPAHGTAINFLICMQCIFYKRGDQKLSFLCKLILTTVNSPAFVLLFFYINNSTDKYSFISYFFYVKLILTFLKYPPQVYMNYKRKSTQGWSIYYCYLDFIGGTFSLFQTFINSINQNDWSSFEINIIVFGFCSILFNIIFFFQHFILYPLKVEIPMYNLSTLNVNPNPTILIDKRSSLQLIRNDSINHNSTKITHKNKIKKIHGFKNDAFNS